MKQNFVSDTTQQNVPAYQSLQKRHELKTQVTNVITPFLKLSFLLSFRF